jgi:hypothetical protein
VFQAASPPENQQASADIEKIAENGSFVGFLACIGVFLTFVVTITFGKKSYF